MHSSFLELLPLSLFWTGGVKVVKSHVFNMPFLNLGALGRSPGVSVPSVVDPPPSSEYLAHFAERVIVYQ